MGCFFFCFFFYFPPSIYRSHLEGVPLSIDWATCAPLGRIVGACSGGAVVIWTVPCAADAEVPFDPSNCRLGTEAARGPRPALPAIQLASTGCPQRSVAWAPSHDVGDYNVEPHAPPPATAAAAASDADDGGAAAAGGAMGQKGARSAPKKPGVGGERRRATSRSGDGGVGSTVASAGHCMVAPAVWDARDPFSPLVGKRSELFSGFAFQLSVAWLPFGCAVTGYGGGQNFCVVFFLTITYNLFFRSLFCPGND